MIKNNSLKTIYCVVYFHKQACPKIFFLFDTTRRKMGFQLQIHASLTNALVMKKKNMKESISNLFFDQVPIMP